MRVAALALMPPWRERTVALSALSALLRRWRERTVALTARMRPGEGTGRRFARRYLIRDTPQEYHE